MTTILDDLIRRIESSGLTRYQIAQESGIAESQLSRLVNGHSGLSVQSVEAVAVALGLKLVLQPTRRGRRKD